ncbi:MAG: 2-C-methyl-D-erythritol 4-phosphate cytidylyltransferase [Tannerella sp.]|jgi:2-C-methyl-D-erythritol 4-phosphate cytidylyltransferase|nr:2-C-methyl-D-erythritol 4-phosphate cytidylyltransferase [Tannerella sp.]
MRRGVVILAGGKGIRMGNDLPKQFIPLYGKPVLMYTLEVFYRWDSSAQLILVLPEELKSYWEMLCRELNCKIPYRLVTGGETRFHSVQNGLREVGECDLIGIHDGVRPFVSTQVIETCFRTAEEKGAVMAVVPSIDSLRMKIGDKNRAVDRRNYFIVQTPQVFYRDWILEAYQQPYQPDFFDDATVVESFGKTIHLIEGNLENIKITTPMDLIVAERFINKGQ